VLICGSCGQENPEGSRFCNICGAALAAAAAPREVRKTVTVLFCDVTGSTALGESTDPEALRELLARYFERMKAIVERHGGTVEKFIGDAVMAVFGVPVVHEDDALRACRAALEMRDALPELGVNGRIGVNTGEVVTGTEERLATGDAVNVAARLEQAAQPGEVLIGAATRTLVQAAVDAEPVPPLELKGKAERVPAWRLLAVTPEMERRFATAMVGRERELRSLRDALARAVHDRSCQLFTVLGSAGVGKSRLAAEFLTGIEAHVVRGRCLSYGDGITYWPVVEVLKQLDALPDDAAAAVPLRSLMGERAQASSAEEIAWGFRKLLEQEAQREPLVCVFDDLHWAEPTFLALVESVAELSRDAPTLLLCMARPELLELRPSWGGGMWNATTVLLEPLDAAETEELLGALGGVDCELAGRISAAADGNPLFLEEMLALVRASPDNQVEVPPTIQALLAARLDQLDVSERAVLERGAIEGRVFHRGAVEALADGEPQSERLLGLVRKQLVRPDRPQLPQEDAYRFRHLLIRDAAYDGLPKSARADLHRRFADWLTVHGQDLVELEEIVGYHLEQASRYLAELGRGDQSIADEAAGRLASAGLRARGRGDHNAAASLLGRAVALVEKPDVHIVIALARSILDDMPESIRLVDEAAVRADASGDAAGAALARAVAAALRVDIGVSVDEQERLAQAALPLLEAAEDHAGLSEVWSALAFGAYNSGCRYADMEHAAEEALRHAALAGQSRTRVEMLAVALVHGPRPADEALRRIDALAPEFPHPMTDMCRAVLLAMTGEIEAARSVAETAESRARELVDHPFIHSAVAEVDQAVGDDEAVSERLRLFNEHCAAQGATALLGTYGPLRALALCHLGRYDEAARIVVETRELPPPDDPVGQSLWRQAAALVLAQRGDHSAADLLAREAVALAETVDSPGGEAHAHFHFAEVLESAERYEEAASAFGAALEFYERKGIVPLARRTRERLAALQPA
jgi:class 3 adenylate cyclase/tetratricopeptide (TPR) repeat protein